VFRGFGNSHGGLFSFVFSYSVSLVPVYVGAPYAFFIKFITYLKKKNTLYLWTVAFLSSLSVSFVDFLIRFSLPS
jgi:hypothetical protein